MAKKIRFFPIDIVYRTIDNKPIIFLYGKTTDNKKICVMDDSFEPYFYVIPKKRLDLRAKLEKIKTEDAQVTRTEAVKKKFLGKDIEAVKVYTMLPKDVPIIRDIIKDWTAIDSVNEYDIPFTRRYLIDKGMTPFTLATAEGEFTTQKSRVPVLSAKKIESSAEETLNNPKILAFDIETYTPQKKIDSENHPVIMLSFYGSRFKKVITWKKFKTKHDYIEFVDSEAELIQRFKETIHQYKPDILTGYFSDGFDFPYLETRAKKYKIKLDIGLDYSEIKIRKGKSISSRITGINHIDIYKYVKKMTSMDKLDYRLDNVAEQLIGEKKTEVDLDDLPYAWDNKTAKLNDFCEYNLHDSYLVYKLCEKMLPNLIEMVKIVGLTMYDINRMGFSQLVEWYLLKNAPTYSEIAPNSPHHDEIRQRRMQTFKGAFVYEPVPGLYNDIMIFDFRSLYPSIISSHNISPGTLDCSCCAEKAKLAPIENKKFKYYFCTKKKGFIPIMIEDIIKRRMRIKEIIKGSNPLLEARSLSLKLLANSFYGYLGFFGARWYSIECSRAVTAFGRYYIHKVIDKAKQEGFNVLYSDTDSIFVALDKKKRKDIDKFADEVNMQLPGVMELEFEGYYPSGIFVSAKVGPYGAKKKYALMNEKGNLKIRGFETVRRNWSHIAKEVQEKVLKTILKEKDSEKAFNYVKGVVQQLRKKEVTIEKVIIHTQLKKEISSYDTVGPHVAVANRMKDKGIQVGPGLIIKYVVVKGGKRVRDRARLPNEVKQDEYDADYYIKNQVIPAVEKIFDVLGYSKEELIQKSGQKKLERFFK